MDISLVTPAPHWATVTATCCRRGQPVHPTPGHREVRLQREPQDSWEDGKLRREKGGKFTQVLTPDLRPLGERPSSLGSCDFSSLKWGDLFQAEPLNTKSE